MTTKMEWLGVPYATPITPLTWIEDRQYAEYVGSRRRISSVIGGGYWEYYIRFIDSRTTGIGFHRKLMAHKRRVGPNSFTMTCPQTAGTVGIDGEMYPEPASIDDKLLRLDRKADKGTGQVYLERNAGAPASVILRTGRYITFDGDDTVYMIMQTNDLTFTGSTAQQVLIFPNLRVDLATSIETHLNPMATSQFTVGEMNSQDPEPNALIYDKSIGFRTV